jgi:hypothetical protein
VLASVVLDAVSIATEIDISQTDINASTKKDGGGLPIIPIAAGAGGGLLVLILVLVLCCRKKKENQDSPKAKPEQDLNMASLDVVNVNGDRTYNVRVQ